MLLIAAEQGTQALPRSLQQVLLSGDWIGLDLLPRLRALGSQARFTTLGGATEAAIWSNALDIAVIPEEWVSIPYGYPLAHQYYRVVDQAGRDCPDWVTGELWIGGRGVALGYYREPEKRRRNLSLFIARGFIEQAIMVASGLMGVWSFGATG